MSPKDYAKCLRKVADFYDSAPDDFPIPDGGLQKSYFMAHQGDREKVRGIARLLGDCEKDYTGGMFTLFKNFDGLVLAFIFSREAVCEKKVIGFKECAGYTIAPYKEEIVEWECKSILSQEEADALYQSTRTEETKSTSGENPNRTERESDIPY